MMSHCRDIELQLTEYAAGDLPAADAALVARHLDRCPACRHELDLENELRSTLYSLPVATCPSAVGSGPAEPARRRPLPRSWWPTGAGLVAAAGLAAILIGGLADRTPTTEPAVAWSAQEIADARESVLYTLTLTAEALERTQRKAVIEVFGERLPHAVNGSLKMKPTQQGDEG